MFSPRWKKVLNDLASAKGRLAMMVIAIGVSIFGVGTILSAYAILTREIRENYLGTNPASAFLELDRVDNSIVDAVRRRPGVADAEAGSLVLARAEVHPNEWKPLLLFVIRDFRSLRMNTFRSEAGAYPPPDRTILMEREALALFKGRIGDGLNLQTPHGIKRSITVSGTVHDPGLAPSWQEQMLYGYITPSTLDWLGEGSRLHILKVSLNGVPDSAADIDAGIGNLAGWIKTRGYAVDEIRIPPARRHPHQSQMTSVLSLLLVFSILTLLLSAILTATMVGGLLAGQIRQIGIMKAIGASTGQIANLYLVLIVSVGMLAVAVGLPAGILAGRGFARVVAKLLNFTLFSEAIPLWVYIVEAGTGILLPLAMTSIPILGATRRTVREILNDYGTSLESPGAGRLEAFLGKIRGIDTTLILSIRNTFRRRGRLLLTLGLLASAGALFMTGINVKRGWDQILVDARESRHYDLEIRFNQPQSEKRLLEAIKNLPGVRHIEPWNTASVALFRPDGLEIVRTYPDGGHGSLTLRSAPLESRMIDWSMIEGRRLQREDTDGVVLNQMGAAFFPGVKVGDRIRLNTHGRIAAFRVIGIAKQILTPACAYVLPQDFAAATGVPATDANAVRIVLNRHDAGSIREASETIEDALRGERIGVNLVISETMLEGATSGHVTIFIYALLLMSAVTAVVGALGLMSSMGTSVLERTREFGIMRAIGARSGTILRNILAEGVFIGILSWGLALALSIPLTIGVGNLIGNLSFRVSLPLTVPFLSATTWLLIVVIGSMAASVYPAWQASRLTIRETLVYV